MRWGKSDSPPQSHYWHCWSGTKSSVKYFNSLGKKVSSLLFFFFFLRTTDVFILSHLPSCCWSPPLETSGLIGSKMFVSKQLGGARGRGLWVDQRLVLWPDRVVERDCVKAAAKSSKYKFWNGNKRHRPLRPKPCMKLLIYSLLLKAWWYITYLLALYCWIIWILWQH